MWADPGYAGWRCEQCRLDPTIHELRGACGLMKRALPVSLAIAGALSDLPDFDHCPIADVIENRELLERIFDEYKGVKRLGIRSDPSVPVDFLVALDVELSAIEQRQEERRRRDQKAKAMVSHGRSR